MTLVELLVIIVVLIVLSRFLFVTLGPRRCTTDLQTTTSKIAATLREAEGRAAAQESSTVWGVYFLNATTTANTASFYALFKTAFVSPTNSVGYYALPQSIRYVTSTIPRGSSTTITFAQITGIPSTSTVISLELQNCQKYGSSTIQLNTNGTVSY